MPDERQRRAELQRRAGLQRRARERRSPGEGRSLAERPPPLCVGTAAHFVAAARHRAVVLAARADPGLFGRVQEGVAAPLFRCPPALDGRRHVVGRERRAAFPRDLALDVGGFSVVHKKRVLGE